MNDELTAMSSREYEAREIDAERVAEEALIWANVSVDYPDYLTRVTDRFIDFLSDGHGNTPFRRKPKFLKRLTQRELEFLREKIWELAPDQMREMYFEWLKEEYITANRLP